MADTSSTIRLIFDGISRGVVEAAAEAKAAIASVSNENRSLKKSFEDVSVIGEAFGQFAGLAKSAGVIAAIAAAGGLIGQAFAGALPAVVALGAAAGTVFLGLDGIKKAATALQAPFNALKTAVSGTFAKNLAGPFTQLAGVIPKLTPDFQAIAVAISGVAAQLIGFVASTRGVILLRTALQGTAQFVSSLGDGLARFLDGFLSAVASARTDMAGLGSAIGDIFGKIGDVLQGLANDDIGTFSKAVEGVTATIRGLGNVIAPLVDLVVRLGAALGNSLGVVLDNLGQAITVAAPGLVDLGSAVGDLLKAAAPLLPVIGQLANDAFAALAAAVREVTPLVKDFADWAQANPGTIKTIAEAIVAVALAFKAVKAAALIVSSIKGVVDVFGAVKDAAEKAALKVGAEEGLTGAFGRLNGALRTAGLIAGLGALAVAMDNVNTQANNGQPQLAGWGGELHDIAGAAKEIATGDFSTIFSQIGQQLDQTNQKWAAGQAPIQQWFNTVKTSFQNDFLGVIGSLPGQVAGFLSTLGATIQTATAGAFDPLINTARTAIDNTAQTVGELPGRAQSALSLLAPILSGVAAGAWAVFGGSSATGIETVLGLVRGVPGQHQGALGGLGGILSGIARGAWAAFQGASSGGIAVVMDLVRGVPGQHSSALGGLVGTLSGIASSAWGAFRNAVSAGIGAAMSLVRSIPGQIAGALGNLGGILFGAGQSVIQGFISGIRSMIGAVASAASAVVSAARAYFPFSPAKVGPFSGSGWTLFSGQALAEAFAQGIRNNTGLIASAATAAMQAAQGPLSSALNASIGASLSAPSLGSADSASTAAALQQIITLLQQPPVVNVTTKIGDEPLRNIVDSQISTNSRQTRRTVGAGAGTTF